MTKLEQAARQALGALEVATTPLAKDRQEVLRAITTLREALSGVQALSAAPGVTSEQRRLIGVIADKIEDGTLFQSGIYPKKDLARFVRNMLDTTPTAPAASPTPQALSAAPAIKPLVWSDESGPTDKIRYNHITAETALGQFSVEWKGRKEEDVPCVYLAGDYIGVASDLGGAKMLAEQHIRELVANLLAASPTPPAEQQDQTGAVDRTGCTAGTEEECTRRGCATSCPAQQSASKAAPGGKFQTRVQPWLLQCFGAEIAADTVERNHRFLEEALELVQSTGCTQSEAHQLVDYVFGRPVGDPAQEVGGVMVTLAALCLANGLDMHNAGEIELARIWTKVEAIRAKQAAKPKHSPLPQSAPQQEAQEPCGRTTGITWRPDTRLQSEQVIKITRDTQPKYGYTTPIYTAPQPAPAPLSEREAFERDWEKRHAPVPTNGRTHDDGRYGDSSIQDAWESWQARAALAAQGGKA